MQLGAINKGIEANPEFGEKLDQFKKNLNEFLAKPGIMTGISLARSVLGIAKPLANAILKDEAQSSQSVDSQEEQQQNVTEQQPSESASDYKKIRRPSSLPSTRGTPRPKPTSGGSSN